MNINEIQALITEGESETLELKKSTAKLNAAFETICGFLNGSGGTVLIGVSDNGRIVGQTMSDSTKREIAKEISKIVPPAQIDVHYIDCDATKKVITLSTKTGEHAPYTYDSRPFQRNQSSTQKISQHLYEQLIVERGQLNHSWEEVLTKEYGIDSLDHDEIYRTITIAVQNRRIPASAISDNVDAILARYKLINNLTLKQAAVVLFAKDIGQHYPQCMLKMARFKGTNKLGEFIDNQQTFGNAFHLLNEADAFLQRHLPIASFFDVNQFERIDKPALPIFPVREALINAICHRDYSTRSGSISLAIYDDRLEIWNNGTLPKELKLEDLSEEHQSWPRNPLIASIFYTMRLIEKWGRGTNKMIETCLANDLPAPTFKEYSGGIAVTFGFKHPMSTSKNNIPKSDFKRRREEILLLLSTPLSASDICEKLQNPPSIRTIQADLLELQNQGLVHQMGKGKKTRWKNKNA